MNEMIPALCSRLIASANALYHVDVTKPGRMPELVAGRAAVMLVLTEDDWEGGRIARRLSVDYSSVTCGIKRAHQLLETDRHFGAVVATLRRVKEQWYREMGT